MHLNQKIRYGVACLFALAKNWGVYLDAELIARSQSIPPAYAHKILQCLAKVGIVFAQKGVGYRLARPLSSITAYEVISALSSCAETSAIALDMGSLFENKVNQVLAGLTLNELAASI